MCWNILLECITCIAFHGILLESITCIAFYRILLECIICIAFFRILLECITCIAFYAILLEFITCFAFLQDCEKSTLLYENFHRECFTYFPETLNFPSWFPVFSLMIPCIFSQELMHYFPPSNLYIWRLRMQHAPSNTSFFQERLATFPEHRFSSHVQPLASSVQQFIAIHWEITLPILGRCSTFPILGRYSTFQILGRCSLGVRHFFLSIKHTEWTGVAQHRSKSEHILWDFSAQLHSWENNVDKRGVRLSYSKVKTIQLFILYHTARSHNIVIKLTFLFKLYIFWSKFLNLQPCIQSK